MKEVKLHQVIAYDGIREIRIENEMAPLSIEGGAQQEIEIMYEVKSREDFDEFEIEDYVSSSFEDGILHLELNTIDELDRISNSKTSLKILLPQVSKLNIEAENYPLSVCEIESQIVINSENAPVSISHCSGSLSIEDENGPIRIKSFAGTIHAELENGPLSAEAISGEKLEIESENGPIKIREAQYPEVRVENENGVIYYETLPVENGNFNFTNENGIVTLVLPLAFDFEMNVESENGSVKCKLDAQIEVSDGNYTIRNGNGSNKINITTENGMIKVISDEQINLEFVTQKLNQLKEAIQNSKSFQDKEEIQRHLANIIDYINKNLASINEEKVKQAISTAINKLKETVDSFEVQDAKQAVIESIDNISKIINSELGSIVKQIKEKIEKDFPSDKIKRHIHEQMGNFFDKDSFKKMFDPLKKMKHFKFDLNDTERQEVSERSRMKILEMLESGKITSEEAERLIRAINKE